MVRTSTSRPSGRSTSTFSIVRGLCGPWNTAAFMGSSSGTRRYPIAPRALDHDRPNPSTRRATGVAEPNLTVLIIARILQGLGGGPIIPLSQAILWEIFPFHQRGLAMAIWGVGFILGPILGPTVGGYLADEWSWRWIFYINLPVGIL